MLDFIREIFFTNFLGQINLYMIISFLFKFIFVFIVFFFIYTIVKLITLDIKNIDYTKKKKVYSLLVRYDDGFEKKFNLEKINKIGRNYSNDIQLDSEMVSKEHADIIESEGSYFIIDKNSSNGTYVNGKRVIDNIELLHNDEISIGDYKLIFNVEEREVENEVIHGKH